LNRAAIRNETTTPSVIASRAPTHHDPPCMLHRTASQPSSFKSQGREREREPIRRMDMTTRLMRGDGRTGRAGPVSGRLADNNRATTSSCIQWPRPGFPSECRHTRGKWRRNLFETATGVEAKRRHALWQIVKGGAGRPVAVRRIRPSNVEEARRGSQLQYTTRPGVRDEVVSHGLHRYARHFGLT
jgi:hypothetical protein